MKSKKILSCVLCATVALSNVAYMPTFIGFADAIELSYTIEPFSNKHKNVVEKGEEKLITTRVISDEEARNAAKARGIVEGVAGLIIPNFAGKGISLVGLIDLIVSNPVGGTLKGYKRIEKHYQENLLTGKRTLTAEYHYMRVVFVDKNGKTTTYTGRAKM